MSGKNIYNFIYRLHKLNINLYKIDYKNINEVGITIDEKDYNKVIENKTIYEIEIISYLGLIKLRKIISVYKYILIFIVTSFLIIYFLSNLIFRVDIITNDNKMKNKINKYLISRGISKYHLKKNYKELKSIKEDILSKYKDEIDWIEINTIGSKYIIRYEPRINTKFNKDNRFQNIVAKKNAIIYSMDIKKGQIIKNRFDYVKKGDVIVSGYIYLNDKITNTTKAEGIVLGETWYKVKVKYPYKYKSIKETGKSKKSLSIKFINQDYAFSKYKDYKKVNYTLFKNNILPISIDIEKQIELDIKKENNSYKEAVKKGEKKAINKITRKLKGNDYIKDYKTIKINKLRDKVEIIEFISEIESIGEYKKIEEYIDNEQP